MACCVEGRNGQIEVSPDFGDTWFSLDGALSFNHNISFQENESTSIGDTARGYCRGLRDESLDAEMNMCAQSASQMIIEELLYNDSGRMSIRWRYERRDGAPWYYGNVIPTDASISMSVEDLVSRSLSLRLDGGSAKLSQPW